MGEWVCAAGGARRLRVDAAPAERAGVQRSADGRPAVPPARPRGHRRGRRGAQLADRRRTRRRRRGQLYAGRDELPARDRRTTHLSRRVPLNVHGRQGRIIAKFHYTDTDTGPTRTQRSFAAKSPCPCRARIRVRVMEFSF